MASSRLARSLGWLVVILAIGTVGLVAETKGQERHSVADLLTGVTLLGSGAILGARRSGRLRGMLLVSAGLGWFAVTARIAAFDQFTFVHRALVIHALVLTSLAAATGRREVARVIGFVVVVLGYVASIGGDRALSTAWKYS